MKRKKRRGERERERHPKVPLISREAASKSGMTVSSPEKASRGSISIHNFARIRLSYHSNLPHTRLVFVSRPSGNHFFCLKIFSFLITRFSSQSAQTYRYTMSGKKDKKATILFLSHKRESRELPKSWHHIPTLFKYIANPANKHSNSTFKLVDREDGSLPPFFFSGVAPGPLFALRITLPPLFTLPRCSERDSIGYE
jgi:hypothetical protein